MRPRDLLAGLRLRPIPDTRSRYTPAGVRVLNESWAATAICCEPGCGWHQDHRNNGSDLGISARNHAELHGHQTLMAWYAADRYVPDPDTAPAVSPRPPKAPPSDSDPLGRPDAHPDPTNSRKTNTK